MTPIASNIPTSPASDPVILESGATDLATRSSAWLDEHHVVAWSADAQERVRYGAALQLHLGQFADTSILNIRGSEVSDLYSFCAHLSHAMGLERVRARIDGTSPSGVGSVIEALRSRSPVEESQRIKHRFVIWHDAHVLLKADHRLFGRLVDALAGVAAEHEYCNEDLLLLQRVVFIGGPALSGYHEDERGQFRSWYREADEAPLWGVQSGVARPPVALMRLGA